MLKKFKKYLIKRELKNVIYVTECNGKKFLITTCNGQNALLLQVVI